MSAQTNTAFFLLPLLFLCLLLTHHSITQIRFANAGKVHIPNDLDDDVDDEEDNEWKNSGTKKYSHSSQPHLDLDPSSIDTMEPSQIHQPFVGFVKLQLGFLTTMDALLELAMKWTELLFTGAVEAKFMGINLSTMIFTVKEGEDLEEVKDFLLEQPDAYEIKIGGQVYRRPGDPPAEEVLEMLLKEKEKEKEKANANDEHLKDEL